MTPARTHCRKHGTVLLRTILDVPFCRECRLDDRRELPRVILPGYVQAVTVLQREAEQRRETR